MTYILQYDKTIHWIYSILLSSNHQTHVKSKNQLPVAKEDNYNCGGLAGMNAKFRQFFMTYYWTHEVKMIPMIPETWLTRFFIWPDANTDMLNHSSNNVIILQNC
jgi:hypothetical protein